MRRHSGQAFAVQNVVECIDEVRCGVNQRPVEIEYNDASGNHCGSLPSLAPSCKCAQTKLPKSLHKPVLPHQSRLDTSLAARSMSFLGATAFMTMDELKRQAAARALDHVRDGMRLGLGTGSTAKHFVELLGERVQSGLRVICVPTSEATRADAQRHGIPLTTLDDVDRLDLTVDGADEIDAALNLIKGGGGALLREKIVAAASDRVIVIPDESKWVETLGRFPLPVEVIPFGLAATQRAIGKAFAETGNSGQMVLRKGKDGHVFVTDGGHWTVDAHLGRIMDAPLLAGLVTSDPRGVEHGLFIGLASTAVLAGSQGIRVAERR